MCILEHGLFVTGNYCHALLTIWHRLDCLSCSVNRETYLWGNINHLSMANLQVLFLTSVRNNNSVTEISWFFDGYSTHQQYQVDFLQEIFFCNARGIAHKKKRHSGISEFHGVDFKWYWNWFKNWKQSLWFLPVSLLEVSRPRSVHSLAVKERESSSMP